ncbi:MAG: hypothetical protein IPJ71_10850 [Bdellovibrionales bacterium]|nr:hypothetical protein [Bdellovibrionales bacterium]
MKNNHLLNAALSGIIAAGSLGLSSLALAEGVSTDKGHCVGANACKGKSGCAQEGQNSCKGHNGCKGKGFVEKTRAECEKLAKKDKNVKFEEAKPM